MTNLKITKNNRIILERTNTKYGMLEQGGVCDLRISVEPKRLAKILGVPEDQLKTLDLDASYNDKYITYNDVIQHNWEYLLMHSYVVGKGHVIH